MGDAGSLDAGMQAASVLRGTEYTTAEQNTQLHKQRGPQHGKQRRTKIVQTGI